MSLRARLFRRLMPLFVTLGGDDLERRRRDMERAGRMPKPLGYRYGEATAAVLSSPCSVLCAMPGMRSRPAPT